MSASDQPPSPPPESPTPAQPDPPEDPGATGALQGGAGEFNEPTPLPAELFENVEKTHLSAPVDPWAHRRGEPRVFALLWTFYVLIAVAGSVLWLATTGRFTATGYGPAARIMLQVVMAGVTLVWPMTRLSQRRPRRSVLASVGLDVLVVLFPVQMVLWPLLFIAQWPLQVVVAVAVQFFVWSVLAGGCVACALAGEPAPDPDAAELPAGLGGRTRWMLVIVAMLLAGPMAVGIMHGMGTMPPGWLEMLSPFTGLPATTGTGVSGPQAPLTGGQRLAVMGVGGLATLVWGIAGFRAALARSRY